MEIKVKDIAVAVSGRKIFSGVSFEVKEGEMVALTGASGCGKTTLLNCLGLIQKADNGEIIINGNDTTKWKEKERTKFWHDQAAFVYQDYGIIEDESVSYNITLDKHKKGNDEVKKILEKVGLEGRGKELAVVLSGGEKQRIGIARAILKNAAVIYADEPTASLDAANREFVIGLLRQCTKEGAIVVLATHDERLVNECDQIIEISKFNGGI